MRFFFDASEAFHIELTTLYNFVNPLTAALWNLRWQVQGYLHARPNASQSEVLARFVDGSGVRSVDLRTHCLMQTWEAQEVELATLGTYAAISIYEAWTQALPSLTTDQRKKLNVPLGGIPLEQAVGLVPSTVTRITHVPRLRQSPHYSGSRVDDLLTAYRCFKEARNSCAHNGRIADTRAANAYTSASGRLAGLGMNGSGLQVPTLVEGGRIELQLAHLRGLSALLFRMVRTFDTDLAATIIGDTHLEDRWRKTYPNLMEVSGDATRRKNRLTYLNTQVGLPPLASSEVLYSHLRSKRLVI